MTQELPDTNRLYWQCRRGMLELDYLLQHFLSNHYSHLTPTDQQCFVRLLKESDEDLSNWLISPNPNVPKEFASLVAVIKKGDN